MRVTGLIAIMFCFLACSWSFAADEQQTPAADKPKAESQSKETKSEKKAPDFNGRWEAKITRPDGEEMKLVYTFKVDGEKLTGTVVSPRGERTINNGKVKGDEISFEVEAMDNVISYQGKMSEGKIQMKSQAPWGERELELTRVVEITGHWESKFETPDGEEMTMSFTFKVDGDKLTGTVQSPMAELPIDNGKVKGDEFSFDVDVNGMIIGHDCKLSGNEIKMKVKGFGDEEREFILKPAAEK